MDEAMNDLTFIATGLYGKPIHKQNGAPLRLVAPWKYGFKSVKSIVSRRVQRQAAGLVLGEAAGERIRLLGQREPAGAASALEPGDREAAGQRRAHPDPALQRLRRVRGRAVRRPQSGKALHLVAACLCLAAPARATTGAGPRGRGRNFSEVEPPFRACRRCRPVGIAESVRTGVSQQADQDRRALRRRQRHRPDGARARRQAAGDPEAADRRRRQARRLGPARRLGGRDGAGRRLHAADGHQLDQRRQSGAVQEALLRSGEGFRADHALRDRRQRAGGQQRPADQVGRRADRLRQEESRAS